MDSAEGRVSAPEDPLGPLGLGGQPHPLVRVDQLGLENRLGLVLPVDRWFPQSPVARWLRESPVSLAALAVDLSSPDRHAVG